VALPIARRPLQGPVLGGRKRASGRDRLVEDRARRAVRAPAPRSRCAPSGFSVLISAPGEAGPPRRPIPQRGNASPAWAGSARSCFLAPTRGTSARERLGPVLPRRRHVGAPRRRLLRMFWSSRHRGECRRTRGRGGSLQYIATPGRSRRPSIRCHSHSGRSMARRGGVQAGSTARAARGRRPRLRQGAVAPRGYSMSKSSSSTHTQLGPAVLIERWGCLRNSGRDVLALAPAGL